MRNLLIAFALLFPCFSFGQEKNLDRQNREEIRQEAEANLELLNKKIDSLKVKLNKELSEEKVQLQEAMDNIEAKRKDLKAKIDSQDLDIDLDEWKKNIKKAWIDLKEKLQEYENMSSKEQSIRG
jgi:hypothetical protein